MPGYADYGVSPAQLRKLRTAAQKARGANYARYSKFMVLAAVVTPKGVFAGSNVENVNYTLTKHAEEVAILAAIHAGVGPWGKWIDALYLTGAPPCGGCRQFISEFAGPDAIILIDRIDQDEIRNASLPDLGDENIEAWRFGELFPAPFTAEDLGFED
jgi:cytidine deaminase